MTNNRPIRLHSLAYISINIHCPLLCDKVFVSDLRQINGFPWVLGFPPPIKLISTTNLYPELSVLTLSTISVNAYMPRNLAKSVY